MSNVISSRHRRVRKFHAPNQRFDPKRSTQAKQRTRQYRALRTVKQHNGTASNYGF